MTTKYDLIIIGGGAAGLLAAISARRHHRDWKIALIEKNASLGRKILITGAGRCNLTNINLGVKGEQRYNQPDFVKKVFTQFGYEEITKFFTDLGLKLVEEKKNNTGKMFPFSDQASSVVDLLVDAVMNSDIDIKKESICFDIKKLKDGFTIFLKSKEGNKEMEAKTIILATGGKTYPALGADGSGFALVSKLGHSIVAPIPSGVPLEGKNKLGQELQGLKLAVEVQISESKSVTGDLIFTQYGLSGMAILLASNWLSNDFNRLQKKNVSVKINFMPGYSLKSAVSFWSARKEKYPERLIEIDWSGVFPAKFSRAFLKLVGLAGKKYRLTTSTELEKAVRLLVDYPWSLTATRGWNEAEFTAGGVDCAEINPLTLESKKIPGLYLAGEIIDVDGPIGGYNLSWAWSSGFVAGKAV